MATDYQIHLNFIPVNGDLPSFLVHRKLQTSPQELRPDPATMLYRLPESSQPEAKWNPYWVSKDPMTGFESFAVTPHLNRDLTCRALFWSLLDATRRTIASERFRVPENPFIAEVSFIQRIHPEGQELLVVQPYYLRQSRQFGFLVDFHFHLNRAIPFSRKVQQLSLSLDRGFRRNLDYYVDRTSKMRGFVSERQDVLGHLGFTGTNLPIVLASDFAALPADRLRSKVYVFAGNKESRGQFIGLKTHGPLKPLERPPRLLFMFREQDRHAARILAQNLRGSTQRERASFPGFNSLFKCDLQIDGNPEILPDLSQTAIERALIRVKSEMQSQPSTMPIIVLPAGDDNGYHIQKALFAHAEIPTQVCTLRILQDEDALKWAIGNLALQIFCKAGGYPWKVRPAVERSLIIGISQSHKVQLIGERHVVEKYFAFSVMTDSSGLFQRIQVLGEDSDEGSYLQKLGASLRTVLAESSEQFARVVVHTSFKLKHREIDAIQAAVKSAATSAESTCQFAVVKVNYKSRFFGVNREVNSLVPFEATRVKLGPGEYLVWFEGIFPDRPTVTKAFPGPTHLQILRVSDQPGIQDEVLLQDLVNLSGANWRGFNAKSAPVSVFYCHLVADLVRHFHEQGLPLPAVKDITPWFL